MGALVIEHKLSLVLIQFAVATVYVPQSGACVQVCKQTEVENWPLPLENGYHFFI